MTKLQEDEQARHDFVAERWKEMNRSGAVDSLLTQHLPVEVVKPDVHVYAGAFADPEDDRAGVLATAFRYDGRDNPPLTPEQAEYVVSVLLLVARKFASVYLEGV